MFDAPPLNAPPKSIYYFASDFHLGAYALADTKAQERLLVSWIQTIAHTAKALYLLGDIFDYWFEYKSVVPRGYTRFLGALANLADSGTELHILPGNHDVWQRDYLACELGATLHPTPFITQLLGRTFRLSHGDWEYRTQTKSSLLLYKVFRNPFLQWCYRGLHPDMTLPFAMRWSLRNRKRHLQQEECAPAVTDAHFRLLEPQKELLYTAGIALARAYPQVQTFVYGHRHQVIRHPLPGGSELICLGDWIRRNSYLSWDGEALRLHHYHLP